TLALSCLNILSLHDALPICTEKVLAVCPSISPMVWIVLHTGTGMGGSVPKGMVYIPFFFSIGSLSLYKTNQSQVSISSSIFFFTLLQLLIQSFHSELDALAL